MITRERPVEQRLEAHRVVPEQARRQRTARGPARRSARPAAFDGSTVDARALQRGDLGAERAGGPARCRPPRPRRRACGRPSRRGARALADGDRRAARAGSGCAARPEHQVEQQHAHVRDRPRPRARVASRARSGRSSGAGRPTRELVVAQVQDPRRTLAQERRDRSRAAPRAADAPRGPACRPCRARARRRGVRRPRRRSSAHGRRRDRRTRAASTRCRRTAVAAAARAASSSVVTHVPGRVGARGDAEAADDDGLAGGARSPSSSAGSTRGRGRLRDDDDHLGRRVGARAPRAPAWSWRRRPPRRGRGRRRRCRARCPHRARPAATRRPAARCPTRPRSRCGRAGRRWRSRGRRRSGRRCRSPGPMQRSRRSHGDALQLDLVGEGHVVAEQEHVQAAPERGAAPRASRRRRARRSAARFAPGSCSQRGVERAGPGRPGGLARPVPLVEQPRAGGQRGLRRRVRLARRTARIRSRGGGGPRLRRRQARRRQQRRGWPACP